MSDYQFKVLTRQFQNGDGRFLVRMVPGHLYVRFPSGGMLESPYKDFSLEQQRKIFWSQVPECMAARDFREAAMISINIQRGAKGGINAEL